MLRTPHSQHRALSSPLPHLTLSYELRLLPRRNALCGENGGRQANLSRGICVARCGRFVGRANASLSRIQHSASAICLRSVVYA